MKQPYVICGDGVALARREEVEKAGARVIPVELDDAGECGICYWSSLQKIGAVYS